MSRMYTVTLVNASFVYDMDVCKYRTICGTYSTADRIGLEASSRMYWFACLQLSTKCGSRLIR